MNIASLSVLNWWIGRDEAPSCEKRAKQRARTRKRKREGKSKRVEEAVPETVCMRTKA
jgi:hypothetical protein